MFEFPTDCAIFLSLKHTMSVKLEARKISVHTKVTFTMSLTLLATDKT